MAESVAVLYNWLHQSQIDRVGDTDGSNTPTRYDYEIYHQVNLDYFNNLLLKKFKSIRVLTTKALNMFNNITITNNILAIQENDGNPVKYVYITPGYYTTDTLETVVNASLASAGLTYTYTYDRTLKTLSSTGLFYLVDQAFNVMPILGLELNFDSVYVNSLPLIDSNFSPIPNAYLRCSLLKGVDQGHYVNYKNTDLSLIPSAPKYAHYGVIATVPISADHNKFIHFNSPKIDSWLFTIPPVASTFTLVWTDKYGYEFSPNGPWLTLIEYGFESRENIRTEKIRIT